MAEKPAISFVTILVPFLVLRNSKLLVTVSLTFLCNRMTLVVEVSTMGGGLPDLLSNGCSWLVRCFIHVHSLCPQGRKEVFRWYFTLGFYPRVPRARCRIRLFSPALLRGFACASFAREIPQVNLLFVPAGATLTFPCGWQHRGPEWL
jgi:hypothetical protein